MKTVLPVFALLLVFGGVCRAEEPKLFATLTGHRGAVNAVAFDPRGTVLASASDDRTVKLWRLSSSTNIATFELPSPVLSVAFSRGYGMKLVAGCSDGTVQMWNLVTGYSATFHAELPARRVEFSGDQICVQYPTKDRPIDGSDFWDLRTGKKVPLVINSNSLNLDVCAETNQWSAIANEEPHWPEYPAYPGEISVTTRTSKDASTEPPVIFRRHSQRVTCLAASPNYGKWLASGSLDRTIKLWNPVTGANPFTLTGHTAAVLCLAFSPNGRVLASGSADETIKLWEIPEGEDRGPRQENSWWDSTLRFLDLR